MKRYIIAGILLLSLLPSEILVSQEVPSEKKNNVYAEFLGVAGIYSLNYERMFYRVNPWICFSARGGVSLYNNITLNMPLNGSVLFGKKSHRLELGTGLCPELYISKNASDGLIKHFFKIGYRYQPVQGGLHFQFSVQPITYLDDYYKSSWLGIGVGWCF